MSRLPSLTVAAAVLCVLGVPASALAQTDEIQVYDGVLTAPGVVNLTIHTNFTPKGLETPAFPGAVVADRSFNGVPEWALGVTDWFEAGLYLPLYSHDKNNGWGIDGMKLRALFAAPGAGTRTFFYGVNFEVSINAKQWDTRRVTSEVRPIVGWHLQSWDVIVNPILDTSYDGLGNLDFAPSMRVAYNVSEAWAVAAEEYADFGPLSDFYASRDQAHQVYGVVNHVGKWMDLEAGIGFGLTSASDKVTLKLMLSKDLTSKKASPQGLKPKT